MKCAIRYNFCDCLRYLSRSSEALCNLLPRSSSPKWKIIIAAKKIQVPYHPEDLEEEIETLEKMLSEKLPLNHLTITFEIICPFSPLHAREHGFVFSSDVYRPHLQGDIYAKGGSI